MKRVLLSGNEAVARGAWEAGVAVGVGYPGTPSTEVLENLAGMVPVRCEWAPNEKVALEVGAGVSMGGRRALVSMKHVGLNVAADPLFTLAYTGVRGGVVVFVADDPGMHSSQNEQDTRNIALAAKVPVLEPSDSQEALDYTRDAFGLSEEWDLPVIVRSTTRLSHSKGLVELGERIEPQPSPFERDVPKYVMMPGFARKRRVDLDERLADVAKWAEDSGLNRIDRGSSKTGVIASGVTYYHVQEALPEVSVLKIGMPYPFPVGVAREFAGSVERLYAVEELGPFIATRLREEGVEVCDPGLGYIGELTPGKVAAGLADAPLGSLRDPIEGLPGRPPLLCAGCPHRGVFHALRKMRATVTGDIGCYTLAALTPLEAMHSCLCMGASIGMAHGLEISGGETARPVVAVIGDSTFAHSGLTGLVNAAYNRGSTTVVVLDNRITAMTGHQQNPVTGKTLMGESTYEMDIEAVARACGASFVATTDPHDLVATRSIIEEAVAAQGLAVVVAKAPCALLLADEHSPFTVDEDACTACRACIRLGCPAISADAESRAVIDLAQCVGCGQCVAVCRYDAIVPAGAACDPKWGGES